MGVYLSKPNLTKDSHDGENDYLKYGVSAMQGWRINMEDAHITNLELQDNVALFAVFDGHGGQEVAKFCGKYFGIELQKNENFIQKNYKEALEETFLKMDQLLLAPDSQSKLVEFKSDSDSQTFAGCTANVVLITKNEVYCANAGDSRAYIYFKSGEVFPLSTDHKPDVDTEKQRITNAGGYVSEGRVNDNLNLSRAIGDFIYKKNEDIPPQKQIITAFPDVTINQVNKNVNFILVGCDGIWETLTALDICKLTTNMLNDGKHQNVSSVCEELLDKLVAKETSEGTGCDNMSLIIIKFKD